MIAVLDLILVANVVSALLLRPVYVRKRERLPSTCRRSSCNITCL